mmetsp:Transcript_6125/g.15036  ORF Transcript_6125/g.15036 Transcript_6125/m.15036 type:complete len:255 (-) Transcript_6125:30-794(-)
MFVLLCGYPPFGGTGDDVLKQVRLGKFTFDDADWKRVSEDAKDLIRKLLTKDPHSRYNADQALNHVWIENQAPKAVGMTLQDNFAHKLRGFRSRQQLKKAALHVMAAQLSQRKIHALRDRFRHLKGKRDGQLSVAEFKEAIEKSGLEEIPADLKQIMQDVSSDDSIRIDFKAFLNAALDKRVYFEQDVFWSAFRSFDRSGDGKISKEDLKQVLGDKGVNHIAGEEATQQVMKDLDGSGDGEVDFEEFLEMMKKQ